MIRVILAWASGVKTKMAELMDGKGMVVAGEEERLVRRARNKEFWNTRCSDGFAHIDLGTRKISKEKPKERCIGGNMSGLGRQDSFVAGIAMAKWKSSDLCCRPESFDSRYEHEWLRVKMECCVWRQYVE